MLTNSSYEKMLLEIDFRRLEWDWQKTRKKCWKLKIHWEGICRTQNPHTTQNGPATIRPIQVSVNSSIWSNFSCSIRSSYATRIFQLSRSQRLYEENYSLFKNCEKNCLTYLSNKSSYVWTFSLKQIKGFMMRVKMDFLLINISFFKLYFSLLLKKLNLSCLFAVQRFLEKQKQ